METITNALETAIIPAIAVAGPSRIINQQKKLIFANLDPISKPDTNVIYSILIQELGVRNVCPSLRSSSRGLDKDKYGGYKHKLYIYQMCITEYEGENIFEKFTYACPKIRLFLRNQGYNLHGIDTIYIELSDELEFNCKQLCLDFLQGRKIRKRRYIGALEAIQGFI
jgi:hypothetical protein